MEPSCCQLVETFKTYLYICSPSGESVQELDESLSVYYCVSGTSTPHPEFGYCLVFSLCDIKSTRL